MSDPLLFVDTSESNVTVTGNLHVTSLTNLTGEVKGGYDTNTTSYFGRAAVGYCGHNDAMSICHIDSNNNGGYALLQESNGETMLNSASGRPVHIRQGNVDKLVINSSGIVTTPSRPAFYAWDNTTSRSGITLTFDSTTYNIGSHYNTSTSRFKTPVAGTYIFAAVLAHDTTNTFGSSYYSFYVDGSNHRDILEGMPSHDAHYEKHGVYIVNLNANQYVDIRSRSGTNITFVNGNHGAYYRNCFQGALLG